MSKYKLFPLVIGIVAVSFLTGTFVYLKFLPAKTACPAPSVSSAPVEENQSVEVEKKFITYQNTQFGFGFKYPEDYIVMEQFFPEVETSDFLYPRREATILQLRKLSAKWNEDYGAFEIKEWESSSVYAMAKGNTSKVLKELNNEKESLQAERERNCAGEEDFDQCAYYGGSWRFSTTTFSGIDAIEALWRGEGDDIYRILIPEKGIVISDNPEIWKEFVFFDKDRIIKNENTGLIFNCPAYWACNYKGLTKEVYFYYGFRDVKFERYEIKGPNQQYMSFSILATSTQIIDNTFDNARNTRGIAKVEGGKFASFPANYIREYYTEELRANGNAGVIQVYISDPGLFLLLDGNSSKINHELEQKFFSGAVIKAKE